MDTEYELTDTILKNLATAKIDHDHVQVSIPYEISKKTPINSIDFSDDGTWLVSSDDFALNVFDVTQGK